MQRTLDRRPPALLLGSTDEQGDITRIQVHNLGPAHVFVTHGTASITVPLDPPFRDSFTTEIALAIGSDARLLEPGKGLLLATGGEFDALREAVADKVALPPGSGGLSGVVRLKVYVETPEKSGTLEAKLKATVRRSGVSLRES